MRLLIDVQDRLVFFEPALKETREVYQRYERISMLLDRSPELVRAVHPISSRLRRGAEARLGAATIDRTVFFASY